MQRELARQQASPPLTTAQPPDQELLLRIQQHEELALGVLYDRYARLLYTVALRITGDRAITEEVLQDVFWGVWRSVGGFRWGSPVIPWLIGVTRHRAIDAIRTKYGRAQAAEIPLDRTEELYSSALSDDPVESSLLRQTIHQALATLSAPQLQIIELVYYGGLTHREIALRLGIPLGTVRSRLRGALLKLHSALHTMTDQ